MTRLSKIQHITQIYQQYISENITYISHKDIIHMKL